MTHTEEAAGILGDYPAEQLRSVVLNLGGHKPTGLADQRACRLDVYVTIHNSSKNSHEVAMK